MLTGSNGHSTRIGVRRLPPGSDRSRRIPSPAPAREKIWISPDNTHKLEHIEPDEARALFLQEEEQLAIFIDGACDAVAVETVRYWIGIADLMPSCFSQLRGSWGRIILVKPSVRKKFARHIKPAFFICEQIPRTIN